MNKDPEITEFRVVMTSFLVDLLDVVMNLTVSILTGSVVLLAEFFQGLADLTATGLLLVGHARAKKKADRLHPFGHGKEIYFWTLISAIIMMTLTATASIYMGWNRLMQPHDITHIGFGFVVLSVAFLTNGYSLSLSYRRLMEHKPFRELLKIFLTANVVATKNAFVLDLMGTLAAATGFISLFLSLVFGETRFDAIGAIIIGITTAILALLLIMGVKGFLVGRRASLEDEEKIKKAALTIPEVKAILDLRTMQIGADKLLVNMEVHMKDKLTTDELEVLTDKIKKKVKDTVPSVQHIQVELETP